MKRIAALMISLFVLTASVGLGLAEEGTAPPAGEMKGNMEMEKPAQKPEAKATEKKSAVKKMKAKKHAAKKEAKKAEAKTEKAPEAATPEAH